MRVMLDTNILISSFIFKSKKINELINELSKNHEIVICSYTIEELKELIKSKFQVDEKALDEFLRDFPYDDVFITGDKDFMGVKIERPEIMTVSKFLEKYCYSK